MKSSIFSRALIKCVRFPAKLSLPAPAAVAPWPISRISFDGWLAGELDGLRSQRHQNSPNVSCSSATWFIHALDVAIASQTFAMKSFSNMYREDDKKAIEDHVEDVVELLDACNYLREKIEGLRNYIDLIRIVLHWLDGNSRPNRTVLERVRVLLDSCEGSEKKFTKLEKCSSNLTKLICKGSRGAKLGSYETELYEILSGSKAITSLAIAAIGIMLSFKTKRGLPTARAGEILPLWSSSFNELRKEMKEEIEKRRKFGGIFLNELRNTITAVKNLRNLVNSQRLGNEDWQRELKVNVEELRKSCGGIEEGIIKPLEGRVNELYKHLISVRLALLNIMPQ
ncbi:Protein BYPASS-related [Macleaya cordata]|uniref:Protein BYPASS-related n=1 Tax=Macleaya cordata TaxID=56857 RepID=A0A200Q0G7_MACCD|nr:Protein BYPASS-related [Macleaya cordata]